jgi:quinol monooxygenase YgiN
LLCFLLRVFGRQTGKPRQLPAGSQVIVFSLHLKTPPEKRTAILRTLGALLGPTRVAPGCLIARLLVDIDDIQGIVLVEEWESRAQFEMQMDADKLNSLVAVIELSNETPIVHIDSVTREEGISTLPFDQYAVRSATR